MFAGNEAVGEQERADEENPKSLLTKGVAGKIPE